MRSNRAIARWRQSIPLCKLKIQKSPADPAQVYGHIKSSFDSQLLGAFSGQPAAAYANACAFIAENTESLGHLSPQFDPYCTSFHQRLADADSAGIVCTRALRAGQNVKRAGAKETSGWSLRDLISTPNPVILFRILGNPIVSLSFLTWKKQGARRAAEDLSQTGRGIFFCLFILYPFVGNNHEGVRPPEFQVELERTVGFKNPVGRSENGGR
jgi:hypothetical protein